MCAARRRHSAKAARVIRAIRAVALASASSPAAMAASAKRAQLPSERLSTLRLQPESANSSHSRSRRVSAAKRRHCCSIDPAHTRNHRVAASSPFVRSSAAYTLHCVNAGSKPLRRYCSNAKATLSRTLLPHATLSRHLDRSLPLVLRRFRAAYVSVTILSRRCVAAHLAHRDMHVARLRRANRASAAAVADATAVRRAVSALHALSAAAAWFRIQSRTSHRSAPRSDSISSSFLSASCSRSIAAMLSGERGDGGG